MKLFLIVAAVCAVIYGYALVAFYYNFKKWRPFCGVARTPGKGGITLISKSARTHGKTGA